MKIRYNKDMTKLIAPEDIEPRRPGARPIYPWDTWMDGQWRLAVKGEDYTATTKSFQSSLIHRARTHGYKVRTHLTDEGIAFCFIKEES